MRLLDHDIAAVAFDIDGTLLLGDRDIDGASDAVAAARSAGLRVAFLTNISGQTRAEIAQRLSARGIPASVEDVYSSASAAAAWLAGRRETDSGDGDVVAVIGPPGLREELVAAGIAAVPADAEPTDSARIAAVVIGLDRGYDFTCPTPLAHAVADRARNADVMLLACNLDVSYPGPDGSPRPGCGRLAELVEHQTGRSLDVSVGKPEPHMLHQAAADLGVAPEAVLMVGDSLLSDIGLADACGSPSIYFDRERAGTVAGTDRMLVVTRMSELAALFGGGVGGSAGGAGVSTSESGTAASAAGTDASDGGGAAQPPDARARLDAAVDRVMPRRLHPYREQIMYLLIGGWNTVFGYAVFAGLYWALSASLHITVILIISWVIAVANAYVCYRYLVFRSRGRMHHEIPRFMLVYGVILACNLLILPLALRVLPWNAYVVQAIYTLAVVIVSYVGHRLFSFREGRAMARSENLAGSAAGVPNASQLPDGAHERKS